MMTQVNFDSIGGGGSVKSGTFEIKSTDTFPLTPFDIDTGLGSAIKRFVIIGVSSYYPQPNGGRTLLLGWNSETPTVFITTNTDNQGQYMTIGDTIYGAAPVAISAYDGNGKFTMTTGSLGAAYHQGTYYWYAE